MIKTGIEVIKGIGISKKRKWIAAGNAARDSRDWTAAAENYFNALQEDASDADIWVQFGNVSKESGNLDNAEGAYTKALVLKPDSSDLHLQMGHLQKIKGNKSAAGESYRAALLKDPSNYDAQQELEALGLSSIAEKIIARRSGDVSSNKHKLIFDVSDLVFYIGHHDHLTGIQRVQCCIILSIMKDQLHDENQIEFISFDRVANVFRTIERSKFIELLEDLTLPEEDRLITFDKDQAKVGKLFPAGALSKAIRQGNSTIVLLGAAWVIPDYPSIILNLKRKYDARFVMLFHDFIPVYARETCDQGTADVFKIFVDQIIENVDLALCNSINTARDLTRYCQESGLSEPPSVVTRLGSGFDEFISVREIDDDGASDICPAEPYVLFVSTIEGRKNHDYMLRIWRSMRDRGVKVPKLLCVGRLGWRSESFIQTLLATNYLDGAVEILENVSDAELDKLYAQCQFSVYPSLYEGWGLPIGESLSHGKVCVITNSSSLPEVAGELGVYIPLNDIENSVKIIGELIEKPDVLKQHEAKVRAEFRPITWGNVAEKVLEGCNDARKAEVRPVFPTIKFGTEYLFKTLRVDTHGEMGQKMMNRVTAAHERYILEGLASPHEKIAGLAARDSNWFAAEDWGCWSNGPEAGISLGLDMSELGVEDALALYVTVSSLTEHLPAKLEIISGKTKMGDARELKAGRQLLTWSIPAKTLQTIGKIQKNGKWGGTLTLRLALGKGDTFGEVSHKYGRPMGFGVSSFLVLNKNDLETRLRIVERHSFLI